METSVQSTSVQQVEGDGNAAEPSVPYPGAEFTGHYTKKGSKIYKSARVTKDGETKTSYFTVSHGPKKAYLSKSYLVRNNLSFLHTINR